MSGTRVELLTPTELAAWKGMLETHSVLITRLDDELRREHELPLTSYEVLMNLVDAEPERLRMGELADRLLLSRSGLTRLVDRLERQGFVERERCEDDARGFFAVLTPSGRRQVEAARPTHLAGVRKYFLSQLEPHESDVIAGVWSRLLGQTAEKALDEAA